MSNNKNIEQELNEIAPLLNQLTKTPVQEVPADYFKQFKVQVSAEQAVVKKIIWKKWVAYAAAAVFAGLMIHTGWRFNQPKDFPFDYDRYANVDVAKELNNISDEELQEYLNTSNTLLGAGSNILIEEETGYYEVGDNEKSPANLK
jgi:hypothetical protein